MNSAADAALRSTAGGNLGFWFGGFIIPMVVGYILLRFAGSPKRKAGTAITLRVLAILVAVFLVYAGYVGDGRQLNPGGVLAAVAIVLWAAKQQMARKTA